MTTDFDPNDPPEEDFPPVPGSTTPDDVSGILFDLLQSGNYERLLSESQRVLQKDPDDTVGHFYMIFGYVGVEQVRKARPHLDVLFKEEPEDPDTHLAAISYFFGIKNMSAVRKHATEGMRIDPENSAFHYYAAVTETARMRFKEARRHLNDALRLDPDDTDCLNLKVRLSSIDETSAEDSWRRVDELQEALQLDPHDPALHNTLGDIFLDELDSPKQAEFHYRQSLLSSPRNRTFQKDLFNAVGHRDLLYRLLSIPSRTFTWIGYVWTAVRHQPWRLIFFVIGFKFVIAFIGWLALVTVLFWPAAKVYEWLLISEIKSGARTSLHKLRLWHSFQRWPRLLRFSLFLILVGGLYAGLFHAMDVPLKTGFAFVGIVSAVHFGIILLVWLYKGARRATGKRRRQRQAG